MSVATVTVADCRDYLASLDGASVHAVVCDPPYELGFMGRAWDSTGIAYDVDVWRLVLRALKPGGHLVAFGGSRTYHRLACAIEDAGFAIRDQIIWLYGSGFPKSLNIGNGWGTALKPAHEPAVLARKPFKGTVADNVAEHGTGGVNVDGGRVGHGEPVITTVRTAPRCSGITMAGGVRGGKQSQMASASPSGRWPANVMHDGSDAVAGVFPDAAPAKASARGVYHGNIYGGGKGLSGPDTHRGHTDSGGSAARFFYCAKAAAGEREAGLDRFQPGMARPSMNTKNGAGERFDGSETARRRNTHPTVKPIDLMRHLCRLVTPPGGVVLDPFTGSGTTGCAAVLEGFDFLGCDLSAEYADVARARIAYWQAQRGLTREEAIARDAEGMAPAREQLGLFG